MIDIAKSGFGDIWDRFRTSAGQPTSRGKTSITRKQTELGNTSSGAIPMEAEDEEEEEEGTPMPNYQDYGDIFGGGPGTPEYTGVQQPQQWLDASNIYSQMGQTGMPTSASDWYQNATGQARTDVFDIIKQINEQAGATSYGKRYSPGTARQGMDVASRRMGELGTQFAGMQMGAQEAARNRQLQAAGGLLNAGNYMTQYPLQLADRMYQYGGGMYNVGQNQANDLQQYWQGQQPYNNPWLQNATGLATQQMPMAYPQYGQSGAGQFLGAASAVAPYFFI